MADTWNVIPVMINLNLTGIHLCSRPDSKTLALFIVVFPELGTDLGTGKILAKWRLMKEEIL